MEDYFRGLPQQFKNLRSKHAIRQFLELVPDLYPDGEIRGDELISLILSRAESSTRESREPVQRGLIRPKPYSEIRLESLQNSSVPL